MEHALFKYDLAEPRRHLPEAFHLLQNIEELAKNGGGDGFNFRGWLSRLDFIFPGVQPVYPAARSAR